MAEFRVECLTYARRTSRRARPVPSLTSPGYDLPPTATISHPSRLETQTFVTGTCALTARSPTLYQLSYRDRPEANVARGDGAQLPLLRNHHSRPVSSLSWLVVGDHDSEGQSGAAARTNSHLCWPLTLAPRMPRWR